MQNNKFFALNLEFFIARRLIKGHSGGFSDPIIRIAIIAVALGLAVMIIAMAIVTGFQQEIRDKVIGFGGHIQVSHYDANVSYESTSVETDEALMDELREITGVKHVQVFAYKPGILKTDEDIEGVVLKGAGKDFDWSFFGEKIISGSVIGFSDTAVSNQILISKNTASLLKLEPGDDVRMFFIIDNLIRARRFNIQGIYETGLGEFDDMFVICDIGHIQRLNAWNENQVAGFEILVNDFKHLDAVAEEVYNLIPYDLDAQTIRQVYPQIFDWLQLQDMNVIIVLSLMVLVAVITMISALLIIILERTHTIGMLKAMGYESWNIRKVFLIVAGNIAIKGILWGNFAGLALAFAQKYFGIIKLSQESYYVSVVPIEINFVYLLLLNIGTLIISVLVLLIPSAIISAITPVKAIRYD
ncbi:MAG: ABC transporter permease [Bacteroidales bacterium]|nr:ABC transporter permease [Bacteroidales bacterium]